MCALARIDAKIDAKIDMFAVNELIEDQNRTFDEIKELVPENYWEYFLWRIDATVEITPALTLNEMHLSFLLLCRLQFKKDQLAKDHPDNMKKLNDFLSNEQADLFHEPIMHMPLRKFFDSVNNLQILWKILIDTEEIDACYAILELCMKNTGRLCHAGACDLDFDDMVDVIKQNQRIVNNVCIRKFSSFFYLAYRHLHLNSCAMILEHNEPLQIELHQHLITASLDDFYKLSMYFDTNISDVLHYRHEFSQMFHSISQVMFFHNPQYARRKQRTQEEIISGSYVDSMLPLIMQLYPEVKVMYEDDAYPSNFAIPDTHEIQYDAMPSTPKEWIWIVLPGKIYLLNSLGHVFWSPNLIPLVNLLHKSIDV